jgi:2'-5' RNA ligase
LLTEVALSDHDLPHQSAFDFAIPRPGEPASAPNLFFALQPTEEVADGIMRVQEEVLRRDGPAASRPRAVLHITLCPVGPYQDLERMIDAARRLGAAVRAKRFALELASLSHYRGSEAMVLEPSAVPPALADLRSQLVTGLQRPGFRPGRAFNPHVTLAYKKGEALPPRALDRPIPWRVHDFCLISSVHGASVHSRIDIWALD